MKLFKALILLSFTNVIGQNISISNETVYEGETAHFIVTLSEPSSQAMQIHLLQAASTNGAEFIILNDIIVIPAGETIGTFDVSTTEDDYGEATEYGYIGYYIPNNPSNVYGTLTVLDDDPNVVGEIIAGDDNLTVPTQFVVLFYNVISNDTINGIPATFDSVMLTTLAAPDGIWIQDNGSIQLQGDEPPGVYTIVYQLCAVSDPSNCTTATVTITIFDPLKSEAFAFTDFKCYPNPVKNILSVSNNSSIDTIEITSLIGQTILYQKVQKLQEEINFSELSNGVYFVKVTAEGQEKVIKIVKE